MKLILALLLPVLSFADPASSLAGKNATLRDEKGKSSTTTSTSGSKTTFRDAQGRMTGTATQSNVGKTTFRDAQGRMTGTSTTSGTNTTCRDAQGRISGTSSNILIWSHDLPRFIRPNDRHQHSQRQHHHLPRFIRATDRNSDGEEVTCFDHLNSSNPVHTDRAGWRVLGAIKPTSSRVQFIRPKLQGAQVITILSRLLSPPRA